MLSIKLKLADESHLEVLLSLVRAYHQFEGIVMTDSTRIKALLPLLDQNSPYGQIWLILISENVVGYIAICFGYSIEFVGRDAFVDEFFIEESARGKGIGTEVLTAIKSKLVTLGVTALHLEVAKSNQRAKHLYSKIGFSSRDCFHLMSCKIG